MLPDTAEFILTWPTEWTRCVRCEHQWMGVYTFDATVLECPRCHVFAGIPDPLNAVPLPAEEN
jgi:hypothetical protein